MANPIKPVYRFLKAAKSLLRAVFAHRAEIAQLHELLSDYISKCGSLEAAIGAQNAELAARNARIAEFDNLEAAFAIEQATLKAHLKVQAEDIERLTETIRGFRGQAPGIHCDPSDLDAKLLESKFALIDAFSADVICEYLKLDTYELVRKMAGTVNSENAVAALAYRDGAVGRNQALIATLSKVKTKQFPDRRAGEMRTVNPRAEQPAK
jgi:chromosome segregation ATPase